MNCNATFIGSIFLLLIPICLALIPTNEPTPPLAPSISGQHHPLNELNSTTTGDLTPTPNATSSIAAGLNVSSPSTFDRRHSSASPKSNLSMAIIIAVLLSAFFFMGIFSVYIRGCAVDNATNHRNLYNVNYHSSGNRSSSHDGLISFPFMARQQQRSEEGNRPPHGLDLLLVSSLPATKFAKGKGLKESEAAEPFKTVAECVVCLNEFEEGEELRFVPKCGHCFHQDCIGMWLFSHTTCPLCRCSLLYDTEDKGEEFHESGIHNHERPIMDNEPIGAASAPVMNADVHEPLPLGYLTPSRRPHVVTAFDHHDVPKLQHNTMRRSHSTGHSLHVHLPRPPSFPNALPHRPQLNTLPATVYARGCELWSATCSWPPSHVQLGCPTWSQHTTAPGRELATATTSQPMPDGRLRNAAWIQPNMPVSELGDDEWNRPALTAAGSELERHACTRSQSMHTTEWRRSAIQNQAMSAGNKASHAAWNQFVPYHRTHSDNVLLDLQSMRRSELQGASPDSGSL